MKRTIQLTVLFFIFVFVISLSYAALLPTTDPHRFQGAVTVDGSAASSAKVLVYVAGSLNKIVDADSSGNYVATAEGSAGNSVTFKVYGVSVSQSAQTFTPYAITNLGLTMAKSSSGGSCLYGYSWSDTGCSSSLSCCSDNTCQSSCVTTPGGGGGGGGSSVPTTAPSAPVGVDVVGVDKSTVLESVDLSALGATSADKVTVTKILSQSTIIGDGASLADKVLKEATDDTAKEALEALKEAIKEGTAQGLSVSLEMEVYKVNSQETGKTAYQTVFKAFYTAENDYSELTFILAVPKSVAKSVSDIFFYDTPEILQDDPIVQWKMDDVKKFTKIVRKFAVKKQLTGIDSQAQIMAAGVVSAAKEEAGEKADEGEAEEEAEKETIPEKVVKTVKEKLRARPYWVWIIAGIIIILAIAIGYYIYKKK